VPWAPAVAVIGYVLSNVTAMVWSTWTFVNV
jgi:hypothetical protein